MQQLDTILALIAQEHLDIDTLETRHSDSLDFHDIAVRRILALTINTYTTALAAIVTNGWHKK